MGVAKSEMGNRRLEIAKKASLCPNQNVGGSVLSSHLAAGDLLRFEKQCASRSPPNTSLPGYRVKGPD